MKKATLFILLLIIEKIVTAQSTGNIIWNSNNRFFQNTNYQQASSGKKYLSSQPGIGYMDESIAVGNNFVMSQFEPQTHEVVMNISILFNAKPTGYMAIFHLNQSGKKISDLDSLVTKKVSKFKELAKALGILPTDFYTDMIALVPIFEIGKRSSKPKGFELQKNLHVKYNNANDLDKLFSIAAQCEIYDLIKVEYLYNAAESAGKEMHAKALAVLAEKNTYYKSIGIKTDTSYRSINEWGSVSFPIDKYKSYSPLSVSSLEEEDKPSAENEELMKTRNGMIQRSTVFYNPTLLSGFDAVINPDPLEPPIQFTYTLQVKYKMQQPVKVVDNTKTEKTTELLIVTPAGEIREIKR